MELFDNEHTTYKSIDLNGVEAMLGTSQNFDGSTSYYLLYEKDEMHYSIHGNVELETILKVASGIK